MHSRIHIHTSFTPVFRWLLVMNVLLICQVIALRKVTFRMKLIHLTVLNIPAGSNVIKNDYEKLIGWKSIFKQLHVHRVGIAGADPGFPRGGGANSPRGVPTYDFAKFSQKLHEIERIWTPQGGARPKFFYVDPPLNWIQLVKKFDTSVKSWHFKAIYFSKFSSCRVFLTKPFHTPSPICDNTVDRKKMAYIWAEFAFVML